MALLRAIFVLALHCLAVAGHLHKHHHKHGVRSHVRRQHHPVKLDGTVELTPVGALTSMGSATVPSAAIPSATVLAGSASSLAESKEEQAPVAATGTADSQAQLVEQDAQQEPEQTPEQKLEQVKQDMETAESNRAKIGILEKSLQTQRLLAQEGEAVSQSFQGDAYPGNVVQTQQSQMKEMLGQTQEILEYTKKNAVEASTSALTRAKAVLEDSLAAEQKAEQDIAAARKASDLSTKLMSEAQTELDRANGKQQPTARVAVTAEKKEQVEQASEVEQVAQQEPQESQEQEEDVEQVESQEQVPSVPGRKPEDLLRAQQENAKAEAIARGDPALVTAAPRTLLPPRRVQAQAPPKPSQVPLMPSRPTKTALLQLSQSTEAESDDDEVEDEQEEGDDEASAEPAAAEATAADYASDEQQEQGQEEDDEEDEDDDVAEDAAPQQKKEAFLQMRS